MCGVGAYLLPHSRQLTLLPSSLKSVVIITIISACSIEFFFSYNYLFKYLIYKGRIII